MNYRKLMWQVFSAIFLLTACTKIDTTHLGSDLIPSVDNVNTFETTLDVVANNYIGNEEYRLNTSNPHVVGAISHDPLFGSSKASMFFEMKPLDYPYIFVHYDSLKGADVGFDSAVLVLDYLGYYGDSNAPVNLKLYQVDREIKADTSINPTYNLQPDLAANHSILWGTKTVQANQFKDSISIKRGDSVYEKVVNQLRIRLDDNMARQLFYSDTLTVFKSDSTFKQYLPGFALEGDPSAKTLLYFSLVGASKIEFYYRANGNSVIKDTTSSSFTFTGRSGHAVKFDNNRNGAEVSNALTPDSVNGNQNIYIQASPGTSAKLHIKGLDTFKLTNRVIHRAELRVTQTELPEVSQLVPPRALYIDIIDTTADTYKGMPYDLHAYGVYYCYPAVGINFDYFGGLTKSEMVDGKSLAVYRFNISRYLQAVVSHDEPVYDFRLSAPFYNFYKNCLNPNQAYPPQVFPLLQGNDILDPPGMGRIKVAGGGSSVSDDIRMKLRIIYSKL